MREILLDHERTCFEGDVVVKKEEIHVSPWTYVCPECGKIFSSKKYLNRHIRILHRRQEMIACKECGKVYTQNGGLQKHVLSVHQGVVTNFQCDMCGQLYKQKFNLDRHINLVHMKQFKIFCGVCQKGFVHASEMKQHRAVHEKGEKPIIACSKEGCPRIFASKGNLKYHLIAEHSQEKLALTCNQCGKTYSHPYLYTRHMRIHKKGRPIFPCTVCKKALTTKTSLEHHMRIHTGEKPFVCEHCGKQFSKYSFLKAHRVVHTKEKPFTCKLCDKKYTQRGTLTRHIQECHPK